MQHTTQISLVWHAEDVLSLEPHLTPEQVGEVLDLVENTHDATIGVNWDVISVAIDTLGYARDEIVED